MSGAVDLSALAAKAETARRAPAGAPAGPAGGPPGGPAGGAVLDVTDATFENDVVHRSNQQLVVVELWAPWSPEAQQFSPLLASMAERAGGQWVLARIDVDANPGVAQAFGVQSVPTVVAVALGQPVAAFSGPQPEAQIQGWLDEIFAKVGGALPGAAAATPVPDDDDPRLIAAEELMNDGDLDGALAAYREVVAADPGHLEAVAAVKNLEFIARASGHDPGIVENAAPHDVDAQLAAADVLLLSQDPAGAFDRILAVVRRTSGEEKDRARTRLLELFELFDPSEPFVVAARRKLTAALY